MQHNNFGTEFELISIDKWHQIVDTEFRGFGGIVYSSSGSTQVSRSIIYTDNVINSAVRRTEELIRLLPFSQNSKIAILWGYGLFPPAHFYSLALSKMGHVIYPVGSGRNLPIEIATKNLHIIQPEILIGMPSYLLKLSIFMSDKGFLDSVLPSLSFIISGGEILTDALRTKLELVFKTTVFDSYGMLQAPMIAGECINKRLHISREYEAEILSDNLIKPFGHGELLLSSKYAWVPLEMKHLKTEDIVVLNNETCQCGYATPTIKILGRTTRKRKIRGQIVDINELIFNLDINGFEGKYYIELISDPTDSIIFHVAETTDSEKFHEIVQKNISFSFNIQKHTDFSVLLTKTGKIQHLIENRYVESCD